MTKTAKPVPIDPESVAEVRAAAPAEELLSLVVETFQALADPTRARILYALIRRPMCVRDLALNGAAALTAIPLWIAAAGRSYAYGYGRAEDVAGVIIILIIALSAGIAAYESIQKLIHPSR